MKKSQKCRRQRKLRTRIVLRKVISNRILLRFQPIQSKRFRNKKINLIRVIRIELKK
jgi:hypothetical protein